MAGLVAERPDGDRDVIAVEYRVALVALDDREVPLREEADAVLLVAGLVGLDVRLGDYVDAVAVAEVVPAVVVGIVAGADGVDVVQLEEGDVLDHALHRDGAAVVGVALVAVDALDLDRLAVDVEGVADDLLLLEAHLLRADVAALPEDEGVEVRVLRGPEAHVLHLERRAVRGEIAHLRAGGVEERGSGAGAALDRDRGRLVVLGELRPDGEVPDAVLRLRPEGDVAEDAVEAEHVLVLEEAAVGPLEDLDREDVLLGGIGVEERGDVELARQLGVLGVAGLLAVDPDGVGGVDAVEAEDDVPALPLGGHGEAGAVARDGVVVGTVGVAVADRGALDVALWVPGVGILPVHVAWRAEAAQLKAARHVDRKPVGVVEASLPEVLDAQRGVAGPGDLPSAVERLAEGSGGVDLAGERGCFVRERHRVGARGEAVLGVDGRVFPSRGGGRGRRGGGQERKCGHFRFLLVFRKSRRAGARRRVPRRRRPRSRERGRCRPARRR